MAVQEVSSTGWFGRIGNSIKGILVGIVLGIISLVVLVMNERNAVQDIRANKEIAAVVTSIANDKVDSANEGKLVHLNGPARTEDVLRNPTFGIEENAIRISWDAQIYQWVENKKTETRKKLGGGEETVTTYSYEKKWVNAPVNSSKFKERGHDNTGKQDYKTGSAQATNVTLGAFKLPEGLISQIESSERYELATLPAGLAGAGRITDGVFHTGDLDNPQIGDEKVAFRITKPGDVSVMAVQAKDSFTAYQTKSGKEKFLLYEGLLSAEEIVAEEVAKAKMLRWILRGVGVLLMFIGFTLVLKPLSVLADVVPFIGNLVGGATAIVSLLLSLGISFIVIAISWVAFRPLVGIPLLLVGIGCFVAIIMKAAKAKRAGVAPPPPNVTA